MQQFDEARDICAEHVLRQKLYITFLKNIPKIGDENTSHTKVHTCVITICFQRIQQAVFLDSNSDISLKTCFK